MNFSMMPSVEKDTVCILDMEVSTLAVKQYIYKVLGHFFRLFPYLFSCISQYNSQRTIESKLFMYIKSSFVFRVSWL